MPEFARSYSPPPQLGLLDMFPLTTRRVGSPEFGGRGERFGGRRGGFARQKISRVRRDAHAGRNEEERQSGSRGSSGFFGTTTTAAPCTVSGEGKKTLRAVARSRASGSRVLRVTHRW